MESYIDIGLTETSTDNIKRISADPNKISALNFLLSDYKTMDALCGFIHPENITIFSSLDIYDVIQKVSVLKHKYEKSKGIDSSKVLDECSLF